MMTEWNNPNVSLPTEGRLVEVKLVGGRRLKPVEFALGRFWKFRKGNSGHSYAVEGWREIEVPKRSKPDGATESTD